MLLKFLECHVGLYHPVRLRVERLCVILGERQDKVVEKPRTATTDARHQCQCLARSRQSHKEGATLDPLEVDVVTA